MKKLTAVLLTAFVISIVPTGSGYAGDMDSIIKAVSREVSGNRARDYTMRLWQYDKWSTLPMWQKTAKEARTIMLERGFDEAVIVDTPADGVTRHGTWTNPLGWDCKRSAGIVNRPHSRLSNPKVSPMKTVTSVTTGIIRHR
jgi:hypothetical protein